MRRLILALALLAPGLAGAAQLPMRINFQGKLLDPATSLPKNGTFTMTFKISRVVSGGTALYSETQSNVAVNNGVFSAQIGSVTPLNTELFSGASAYLGITVSPDSEMTPRQYLAMSPYAFTAGQLSAYNDIRINPGVAYSTFSTTGNLFIAAGVTAGTATFTGGLTASSGTFTASGASQYSLQTASGALINGGTLSANGSGGVSARYGVSAATGVFTAAGAGQYSLQTSSGLLVNAGTLRAAGAGGVSAVYGVAASTLALSSFADFDAPAAAPAASDASSSRLYYDATADALNLSVNGRSYAPVGTMSTTLWNTNATGATTNQGLNLATALTELNSAVQGTRMQIDCDNLPSQLALRYNMRSLQTTALTIVMSVRDVTNTANVLVTASQAANAVATYVGESAFAAKPAWCTGTKTVAVYTSGGNGSADYIFASLLLIGAP